MKAILVLLALLVAAPVQAGTLAEVNQAEFNLNRANPNAMAKHLLGTVVMKNDVRVLKCTYDFATQGGAISAINLKNLQGTNCVLPQKAIILQAWIDEVTDLTSGGSATLALSTGQAANDIKAATAIASYTGTALASVPVGTAATIFKLTADSSPTITIAVATVTAGKVNVLFQYVISE